MGHECILDVRELTDRSHVTAEDVCKRLMDFGFHAPTLAFPVPGTLMMEPTESESKEELDRFIEAMETIYDEILEVADGKVALRIRCFVTPRTLWRSSLLTSGTAPTPARRRRTR